MSTSWILFSALLLCLAIVAFLYNNLIRKKYLMQEGWSGVDVQLKRRTDLIPNLVEVVKGYATHEKGVFEEVARLRAEATKASSPFERGHTESLLTTALGQLLAIVENYPELKADKNFLDLQQTLSEIEEQIQFARRYYNATVRDYNIAAQSFPSNIVASLFRFQPAAFFELKNEADRAVPSVEV
ncbi:MAG: LemA family protein [Proteobacteria bacterium]|nr:LemA family protein [Pseudomonadota bacterium]